MLRVLYFLLLSILFLATPTWAQDEDFRVELVEVETRLDQLSAEDRAFLMEHLESLVEFYNANRREITDRSQLMAAHEAFEGEEDEERAEKPRMPERVVNFVRAWAANYNFKRIFYAIHRYYYTDTNVPVRETLRDFISVFCISHSIEVAYGITSVLVALWNGYSWKIVLANAVAGIVISMPGSDPLCWVLLGSYAASLIPRVGLLFRPYKYTVRFIRLSAIRLGRGIAAATGLRRLAGRLFSRVSALERLNQSSGSFFLEGTQVVIRELSESASSFRLTLTRGETRLLDAVFRNNNNASMAVVSLETQLSDGKIAPEVDQILRRISGNLRDSVLQALGIAQQSDTVDQSRLPFFLRNVDCDHNSLRIGFTPGSLHLSSRISLQPRSCRGAFSG